MGVTPQIIDFSKVPEGSAFRKSRQPEGDYEALITNVEDAPSKKDGVAQWLFTIKAGTGVYPYYCKLEEKSYWKVRNLLQAAGISVPNKRANVDPTRLVGKKVGVTLQDTEYNDRLQSEIGAVMPVSEIVAAGEVAEEEDEEEEDEEAPAPTKKAAAKKAAPATADVDDDELEELEVEEL